jgi:hypothetical protein
MSLLTVGHRDFTVNHQKRFSLRDVLIVEAINLDVWISTPVPWWAPTVMVYDNDLE